MFGVDDIVEGAVGGTLWGVALVAGGAAAAFASPRAKPIAKRAIVGYLALTERARTAVAEAVEQAQDLYAEAKYEYSSQLVHDQGEHIEVVAPIPATPKGRGAAAAAEQPA
jgi:hypothetical protein